MDLSGLEFGDGRLGKVAKLLFFCFFFYVNALSGFEVQGLDAKFR